MNNNLKNARELCGLSQKFVSVELGVSAPTVSEWESGRKTPTVDNLLKLQKLYGTTLDYLLCKSDEPFSHVVPPELSLRGISDPSVKKQRIAAIEKWIKDQKSSSLQNYIESNGLPLSERAQQIALAYEVADDDEKTACEVALRRLLSGKASQRKDA